MADRLVPRDGEEPLSPAEIVVRLRQEYSYVVVDQEAGKQHVGDMLATFVRLKAPKEILDFHVQAQPDAVEIVFADDPADEDAVLHTVAMPGGDLFFGYHSEQHERKTNSLIERCARVLGYSRLRM